VVGSSEALERFERQTAWPMLILSLAIIPLLVIPLVADLAPDTEATLIAIDWFLWAVFAERHEHRRRRRHEVRLLERNVGLPRSLPNR
jgi:hypothetical protein